MKVLALRFLASPLLGFGERRQALCPFDQVGPKLQKLLLPQ